jgi:hypothetical protein
MCFTQSADNITSSKYTLSDNSRITFDPISGKTHDSDNLTHKIVTVILFLPSRVYLPYPPGRLSSHFEGPHKSLSSPGCSSVALSSWILLPLESTRLCMASPSLYNRPNSLKTANWGNHWVYSPLIPISH